MRRVTPHASCPPPPPVHPPPQGHKTYQTNMPITRTDMAYPDLWVQPGSKDSAVAAALGIDEDFVLGESVGQSINRSINQSVGHNQSGSVAPFAVLRLLQASTGMQQRSAPVPLSTRRTRPPGPLFRPPPLQRPFTITSCFGSPPARRRWPSGR